MNKILNDLKNSELIKYGQHTSSIQHLNNSRAELERLKESSEKFGFNEESVLNLLQSLQDTIVEWPLNLSALLDINYYKLNVLFDEKANPQIRKPKVALTAHITSKDNLSIRWLPSPRTSVSWKDGVPTSVNKSDFTDFFAETSNQTSGWDRPPSEISLIKGVDILNTLIYREKWELVAHIVNCIMGIFNSIKMFLSQRFSVEQMNEIEFFFEGENRFDWRIVDSVE